MESAALIVTALGAGAAFGAGDATSPVAYAYADLRALVSKWLAGRPGAELLLTSHEKDPGAWRSRLAAELAACGAGNDAELVRAAEAVMARVSATGVLDGAYGVAFRRPPGDGFTDLARGDETNPDLRPVTEFAGGARGQLPLSGMDARGASGVQAGFLNTQINNFFYGNQTWAAQPARPRLADSPYRGLDAFEADDEGWFFGRDDAVEQVLERLKRGLGQSGLVVVSGVSGAGKSSLLRAGVLSRLRQAGLAGVAQSASWPCLLFTPGRAPLDELAVRVASLAGADAATVRNSLAAYPASFALTARQVALAHRSGPAGSPPGPLLLIVDQFEQVFTACPDEEQRRKFITALHAAATPPGPGQAPAALVVLGVRADFEARCTNYPELATAIQDRYLLTAMTERQLRVAITSPATLAGSWVEPELTEVLLTEISSRQASSSPTDGAGVLPLLSHALDQAWRNRSGHSLTLADYERTGGIESAVAHSAQDAYDQLTSVQQAIARQVFTRLTAANSDGTDAAFPASTADLAKDLAGTQTHDLTVVLEAFAGRRLLTLAADTVEITHEVLLTAWPLLRDKWLTESRADRIVRTGLSAAAGEWKRNAHDSAYLYTGSLLETAAAAAARTSADDARYPLLAGEAQAFLDASTRAAHRRARIRQWVVSILAVLVVLLLVASVLFFIQRNTANSERNRAAAAAMAAQSLFTGGSDPAMARLEAAAAWRLDPSSRTVYAMLDAATLPGMAVLRSENISSVNSVAFSSNSEFLAAAMYSGTTQLWNARTRRLAASLPDRGGGSAESAAFSPDSTLLAVGYYSGATQLWDVSNRRLVAWLPGETHGYPVDSVAFSPDGTLLAVGTAAGTTQLWNMRTRRLAATLHASRGYKVGSVAFSPDGKILSMAITGDTDGKIQLWTVRTRRLAATLQPDESSDFDSAAFSPDSKTLAIGTGSGAVQLWNVATRSQAVSLQDSDSGQIDSVAFSPDGRTLAAATGAGTTELFDIGAEQLSVDFPDDDGDSTESVAFSPDGKTLAVSTSGGSIQLTDIATEAALSQPRALLQVETGGSSAWPAFSPDGRTVAIATADGALQLWNVGARSPGVTLRRRGRSVIDAVAFSPDGKTLAVAGSGGAQVWDVATHRLSATFRVGGDHMVDSVSFSPDSKTLAVAANTNGTVGLWNVATHHLNATLRSGTRFGIGSVAFSPDGKILAMGTDYKGSQLWNVATRRLVARLPVSNSATVNSVAFSPDGKSLAVATSIGITQLWDVAHPHQIVASITTDGEDLSAVFSPDSTVLAIGTGEHIQLWDAATDQKISSLPFTIDQTGNPTTDARQLAFSPDGTTLAAGVGYGAIELWNTSFLGDTFSYLCAQVKQPFPRDDWAQFAPGVPYQETCH